MDELTKKYLLDKMNKDPEYLAAQKDLEERQSQNKLAALAAGIGDALARKDSGNTDRYFQNVNQNAIDSTIGEYARRKEAAKNDMKFAQQEALKDPNSQESVNFRNLVQSTMPNIVKGYGDKWNKVAAADQDSILNFGKMREQLDARQDVNKMNNDLKSEAKVEKKKATLNEVEDRRTNIENNIMRLEEMIKDKGTFEAFGSHNKLMEGYLNDIATDMAKLKDPSSVARPGEVENELRGLFVSGDLSLKNSTALDILNKYKQKVNERANTAYKIRGVDNPGTSAAQTKVINGKNYRKVDGGWEQVD